MGRARNWLSTLFRPSGFVANGTCPVVLFPTIAQRLGRTGTPTDQAWIETLSGHVKGDWPHLEQLTVPALLTLELDRVQDEYNSVRLHAGIGYVTPNDEHEGRGDTIR